MLIARDVDSLNRNLATLCLRCGPRRLPAVGQQNAMEMARAFRILNMVVQKSWQQG